MYKYSKRRNNHKPENFDTLFPLSALKMRIKSHWLPSRNKILRSLTVLWFLNFATVYSYFNVQMCSYFIVGNKIFCFFKKWVFALWDEGTFQGRVSNSRGGRGGGRVPPHPIFFETPIFFIFSKFAGLQAESRQLYYQMNSFTGIFDSILSPPLLPPCIDVSPPPCSEHNTCGKPCKGGIKFSKILMGLHLIFLGGPR